MIKVSIISAIMLLGVNFALASDPTPLVYGSIYRIQSNGSKELIKEHGFFMDGPFETMLDTNLNTISCRVASNNPTSTHQVWTGIRCVLTDKKNDLIYRSLVTGFFPASLDNGTEEYFRDEKGRQFLIRFEPTLPMETGTTSGQYQAAGEWTCELNKKQQNGSWMQVGQTSLPVFLLSWKDTRRGGDITDELGIKGSCIARTTYARDDYTSYQEVDCSIQDNNGKTLARKATLKANTLAVEAQAKGSRYRLQCSKSIGNP